MYFFFTFYVYILFCTFAHRYRLWSLTKYKFYDGYFARITFVDKSDDRYRFFSFCFAMYSRVRRGYVSRINTISLNLIRENIARERGSQTRISTTR